MLRTISTHVFLRQRLHPGLLETLTKGGAQGNRNLCRPPALRLHQQASCERDRTWFAPTPWNHSPCTCRSLGTQRWDAGGAPGVNVVHPEKSRRIDAMDEVKRALETAEEMPLRYLILHLGEREDRWSPRTLEHAMTAIEHLQAFARPLGVKLLLENIQNEVTERPTWWRLCALAISKTWGCVWTRDMHTLAGASPRPSPN